MNYESKNEPIIPGSLFIHRIARHFIISALIIAVALGIGVAGYHFIAKFSSIDSLLDASMILGGMGPVGALPSDDAKLFGSPYALFSGLVFIGVTAILVTPVAHRILHAFHVDESDDQNKS